MAAIRAIVFDLDGTLVDSLDDISVALAAALADVSLPAPSRADVRSWLGDGARALVERAVAGRADLDAVLTEFRRHYTTAPVVRTHLYDGVADALDRLAPDRSFAVLSNKPHDLTREVVARLLHRWPFAVVLGQRPGVPIKPDPTAARLAAAELGVPPDQCAMVGDSAVDVSAGRGAGMRTVAVSWGFRDRDTLAATGPDALVDHPDQLDAALA